MKTIYELKEEWANAESCDEVDTRRYCDEKEEQIKLMEGVLELIDKKIKEIKKEPLVNQPKIRVIVLEGLIKEIKGEKDDGKI